MSSPFPLLAPGHRGELYVAEHCRVHVKDGVVVREMAADGSTFDSYNIPVQNTALLLLGKGTSISNEAAYLLAAASVMVAFTGGGGTPLLSGVPVEFLPLCPSNEYRPTEYMQAWAPRFADDAARLEAAKELLRTRVRLTKSLWNSAARHSVDLRGRYPKSGFLAEINGMTSTQDLLAAEGRHAKQIYAHMRGVFATESFSRQTQGDDPINQRLDHFNYLLYGCAAVALHGLGISFAFPALHGKTRRGGLVFDIADLVKDGISIPMAFHHGTVGTNEADARAAFIQAIHQEKIIPLLFEETKRILCGK